MQRPSIFKKLVSFFRETSGQVAMTAAILMPVLLVSAGVALDYSRISSGRSMLNAALDAAILAAGRDMTDGVAIDAAFEENFKNFFLANLMGAGVDPERIELTGFEANGDTGEISATVNMQLDMTLMRIAGIDTVDIGADSAAVFSVDPVEVSIMLDTTGSMQGQKLEDLKSAANSLVNILLPDTRTRGMRIALVPYAGSVNVGNRRNNVSVNTTSVAALSSAVANDVILNSDRHGANNTCVTERGGIYAATDVDPRTAPVGSDKRTEQDALQCPSAQVQPLTNDRGALFSTIDRLNALGSTAGHLGVAWSYYTVSPEWRNIWGGKSKPDAYSSTTRKIVVLMTDGEFNTFYRGTTNSQDPDNIWTAVNEANVVKSNQLALDLCADMKRPRGNGEGIRVYSVAFQAPSSAETTLRRCATPDTPDRIHFFSAQNGDQLRAAFEQIAADIGRLRITR